jgi:hypothetical protein
MVCITANAKDKLLYLKDCPVGTGFTNDSYVGFIINFDKTYHTTCLIISRMNDSIHFEIYDEGAYFTSGTKVFYSSKSSENLTNKV